MTALVPRYRNITVSGLPGCGSTTLLNLLKEHLGPQGWTGFSGGEFMRDYAITQGFAAAGNLHHDASAYPADFDRQVDLGMRQRLETGEHQILESWLSGFMAQGMSGTLRVLMTCSDKAVQVDRIVNRDGVTAHEAIDNMNTRYQRNLSKWSQMYHDQWIEWVVKAGILSVDEPIDFWNPKLYHLVIDTFRLNKNQSLQTVLDVITFPSKNPAPHK